MALTKTIAQKIQEYSDYKKQHEFFVVKPVVGRASKMKPRDIRLKNWLRMFEETHLDLQDYAITGGDALILSFRNGLQISDNGRQVAFSAVEAKEKVDINSALTVVRCSANHLCRQGWDLGINFGTIRHGSAQMVEAFEKSYEEARRLLSKEKIGKLKNLESPSH